MKWKPNAFIFKGDGGGCDDVMTLFSAELKNAMEKNRNIFRLATSFFIKPDLLSRHVFFIFLLKDPSTMPTDTS